MDLSIILPAYNREKTIDKCISSLINQIDENTEIIIVDDGSDDNTVSLCEKYLTNNVKLIKQEHLGVSTARNNGIKNASGKYISFIDSDDYVGENYIKVLKAAITDNPEFVVFDSFECQDKSGSFHKRSIDIPLSKNLHIKSLYPYLINQQINAVWLKLFKADIINENNIEFSKDMIIAEDYLFIMDYISACKSYKTIAYLPYYFNFNMSGTYTVKVEHLLNLMNSYNKTVAFTKSKYQDADTQKMTGRFLQQTVETASKINERGLMSASLENEFVNSGLYTDLIGCDYRKIKSKIEKSILVKKNWKAGIKFFYTVKALENIKNHAK